MKRGRPPVWAIALVCVVLVVAVAGNLLVGWRGRNEEQATVSTIPAAALEVLTQGVDLVVQARALDVKLVGDAAEPSVVADMEVETSFKPRPGPKQVRVFDTGFDVSWRKGDEMILFLRPEPGLPQAVEWKVVRRCVLERGAPPCGFTPDELGRVTDRAAGS